MSEARDATDSPLRCSACGYPRSAERCDRCGGTVRRSPEGPPIRPGPGFAVADLLQGFVSLFVGALNLLHRREYVGKLALPVAANFLALTVFLVGFWFGFREFFAWALADSWGFLEFLRPGPLVRDVIALLLSVVTLYFTTPVIIETVMSPFLDPLAAITERLHGGDSMRAVELGAWRSILIGVRASAQILAVQIALLIPFLLLSLSGIGSVLAIALAAWFNALIWFEIPCARRGYDLRERVALIRRNWARAIGFGLAFQVGMFIPFFNVLFLTPAAAVAASTLFMHFDKTPARANVPSPAPRTQTGRAQT